MSFFPLWEAQRQPTSHDSSAWVVYLEKESADREECVSSEDPDGIEDITKEFIAHLARAVKDAQQEEKCCYHCNSLHHFIHYCPLVVASRTDSHLNQKEGTAPKKGA